MERSFFTHHPERPYQLNHYINQEQFLSEKQYFRLRMGRALEWLTGVNPIVPVRYYKEKSIYYDPIAVELKKGIYLDGYWQSPKYFEGIEEVLRKELIYKRTLSHAACLTLEQIQTKHSVGLHIRRGDYLLPSFNAVHPVLPASYYQQAIEVLAHQFKDLHFFVFSDDPAWVQAHIKLSYPVSYIDNSQNALEDFELLRACKHNVIANSTFSWWAAWLNTYPQKQVIAPKLWIKTDTNATRDLIPLSWKLLEATP